MYMAITELGFKVKIKMAEQGIDQKTLAEKLGCTTTVLSNVINGGNNLRLEEALEYYVKTGRTYQYDYDKNR